MCLFFFFFKQKTAYEMRISDWSSDVCSSDLAIGIDRARRAAAAGGDAGRRPDRHHRNGRSRDHRYRAPVPRTGRPGKLGRDLSDDRGKVPEAQLCRTMEGGIGKSALAARRDAIAPADERAEPACPPLWP